MPSPTPDFLKVVVNPYTATDAKGRPAGAWLALVEDRKYRDNPNHPDPSKRFEERTFVGAKRRSVPKDPTKKPRTIRLKSKGGKVLVHTFPVPHEHSFEHSKEVVSVPNTPYNIAGIKEQALFPADLQSHVAAGGDPEQFVDAKTRLAWAKEGAVHQLLSHHYPQQLAASQLDPDHDDYASLEESMTDVEDPRLETLASHWDGHVEQRHGVGAMFAASAGAKPEAKAAARKAAAAKVLADRKAARDAAEVEVQKALAAKKGAASPAAAKTTSPAPAPAAPADASKGGK